MKKLLGKFALASYTLFRHLTHKSSRCGTVYRRIEELEDIVQQTAIPERDRGRSLDYGDDERSASRLMGAEPATAADESTLVLQFRRLRILARTLNTPSDWLWDSLPTNELSESTLREYLTHIFGKHEFHTKVWHMYLTKTPGLILSTAPSVAEDFLI
jgi:hypothetical protein